MISTSSSHRSESSDIVSGRSLSRTMRFSSSNDWLCFSIAAFLYRVTRVVWAPAATDFALSRRARRYLSLTVMPSCFGGRPRFFGGKLGSLTDLLRRLDWCRPRGLFDKESLILPKSFSSYTLGWCGQFTLMSTWQTIMRSELQLSRSCARSLDFVRFASCLNYLSTSDLRYCFEYSNKIIDFR